MQVQFSTLSSRVNNGSQVYSRAEGLFSSIFTAAPGWLALKLAKVFVVGCPGE